LKNPIEAFEATSAILKGHFILTSGKHADTYMQCAKVFAEPKYAGPLVKALAKKLKALKISLVASPAVGGIIFGYMLAAALGCKNIFCERQDGKMTLRRGFEIKAGDRVLCAEDVVTTGGSVKEVVELCRQKGAEVVGVASLVDRSGGKAEFGCEFFSLIKVDVKAYEPDECPLCKEGVPAVKPGSRSL